MNKHYALFDAHCDTALRLLAGESLRDRPGPVSLREAAGFSRWRQIFAFCCEQPEVPGDILWDRLSAQLAEFHRLLPAGVDAVPGVEGCEQLSRREGARKACDAGVRIFGITWNYDNRYCGAAAGTGSGLTPEGKTLVGEIEALCGVVDCSHMSERGFYDLADAASRPFMASHSNARALCDHPRNLTDAQLHTLARTGSIAGVNFYLPFIVKRGGAGISRVADHVIHMMGIIGAGGLCLGADFDGCDRLPAGLDRISALPRLGEELLSRGLTEDEVRGLFHDNLYQFLHTKLRSI